MRRLVQIAFVTAAVLLPGVPVFGQQADNAGKYPWEGEVAGANVYVRSGAGNNWYPTTKLSAGDRVLVLGERFGWYQIAPPTGSLSYIDMSTVDRRAGAKSGTVKQDKVYVRAGSALEPQRKSSTQVVLNKGATVEITGEADGFYQIKPPQGATLYISKQYIRPVAASLRTGLVEKHVSANQEPAPQAEKQVAAAMPTAEKQSPAPSAPPPIAAEPERIPLPAESDQVGTHDTGQPVKPVELDNEAAADEKPVDENVPAKQPPKPKAAKQTPAGTNEPAPGSPPATGRYKAMLTMTEGELNDMLRRPFEDQDFAALMKRYEPIANQSEESIPSQIAKIRMRQLQDRTQLRLARLDIDKDTKDLQELHANMDKERVKIMNRRVEKAAERYDLEGELRESFAFAPENRRYRLVDQKTQVTIAYVDIPVSVEGNPRHLVGQLVGIKTSGKKFSPSARVPIAVASELIDLSPRKKMPPGKTPVDSENNSPAGDNSSSGAALPGAPAPEPAEPDSGTDSEP